MLPLKNFYDLKFCESIEIVNISEKHAMIFNLTSKKKKIPVKYAHKLIYRIFEDIILITDIQKKEII